MKIPMSAKRIWFVRITAGISKYDGLECDKDWKRYELIKKRINKKENIVGAAILRSLGKWGQAFMILPSNTMKRIDKIVHKQIIKKP
ncbi:hypothetical protein [Methanospirillum sp.]